MRVYGKIRMFLCHLCAVLGCQDFCMLYCKEPQTCQPSADVLPTVEQLFVSSLMTSREACRCRGGECLAEDVSWKLHGGGLYFFLNINPACMVDRCHAWVRLRTIEHSQYSRTAPSLTETIKTWIPAHKILWEHGCLEAQVSVHPSIPAGEPGQ